MHLCKSSDAHARRGQVALMKEEKDEADAYLAEFETMSIQENETLEAAKKKAVEDLAAASAEMDGFVEQYEELEAKVTEVEAQLAGEKERHEKTKKQKRTAAKAAAEALERAQAQAQEAVDGDSAQYDV